MCKKHLITCETQPPVKPGAKYLAPRFTWDLLGVLRFSIFRLPLLVVLCCALYGCSIDQYFKPKETPYEELSACYGRIKLKATSSLDVLEMLHKPGYELEPGSVELLSQSDTAAASLGQSKSGYKTWFTMVVFNEQSMTAERKYFYLVDEKAKTSLISPGEGLIFDGQIILPVEVLEKPYMTEEAKQIAILKWIADSIRKDTDELSKAAANEASQSYQKLAVSGMFMNQVFKTVLLELDKSPALAKNLSDKSGIQFDHLNFDKGKIQMTVDDSIVTIKITLGSFIDMFENEEEIVTTARLSSPKSGLTAKQNI